MAENRITGDYGVIQVTRFIDSSNPNQYATWSARETMPFTKYNIRESDMRVKTATFTSPRYLDLTTGQYGLRIVSKYHENFAGLILDVEYDEDTGMYNYQCQDFSRFFMGKFELIVKNAQVYRLLLHLITKGSLAYAKKMSRKGIEINTSGLKPLKYYDQSLYTGNHFKGNPFNKNISIIARDKTWIEVIRDIVFSRLGYFDVWFNDRGVLQIEPLSKTDWENTGLHLSANEYGSRKFKFSTTNAIVGVVVNGSDAKAGKGIKSQDLFNLDLKAFFGWSTTSIANPVQKTNAVKTTGKSNKSNVTGGGTNPYGTKNKVVYMNIDVIDGGSSDQNKMDTMCDILKKHGWECHTCGVGSESHYERRGEVHDGIWFTLYGGACAGTLYETCTNKWYRSPLVDHGSRTVVGFFPPAGNIRKGGKYYEWLPRAHDDGFSSYNFSGISHMADMLTNCAVPFMYADGPSEMVAKFLKGGDNPEACTKNWKFYSR